MSIKISPERLFKDEYEMQYYGFSTTLFMEEFKEFIKHVIQITLTDLEANVSKDYNCKDILKKSVDELHSLYMESFKNAMQKFEEEFRHMFSIPDNILLEEDKIKSQVVSNDEIQTLQKDIETLENDLIQLKVFLAKCEQTKQIFDTNIDPIVKKVRELLKLEHVKHKNVKEIESSKKMLELFNHKINQFVHATKGIDGDIQTCIIVEDFHFKRNK